MSNSSSKRRSSLQTPLSPLDEEATIAAAPRVKSSRAPKLSLSCDAIRTAVKSLYNLDDFWLHKIGEGFFSEVFKVGNTPHMTSALRDLPQLSHTIPSEH